jgi:hypothetical protein
LRKIFDNLDDAKDALIKLIEWYRDEYHKADWCHSKMIEKIKDIYSFAELEHYEQIVDGWLD